MVIAYSIFFTASLVPFFFKDNVPVARKLTDDLFIINLFIVMNLLLFGAMLLLPVNTFDSVRTFAWLRAHGTENQWGVVFLASGIGTLVCLLFGSLYVKIVSLVFTSFLLGLLTFSYVESNPAGTGWITYALTTVLNYWTAWRLVTKANDVREY